MSNQQTVCQVIATVRMPIAIRSLVAIAEALAKQYGDDVIMWEEPKGLLNFGKPLEKEND